jgi:hypothetical protein
MELGAIAPKDRPVTAKVSNTVLDHATNPGICADSRSKSTLSHCISRRIVALPTSCPGLPANWAAGTMRRIESDSTAAAALPSTTSPFGSALFRRSTARRGEFDVFTEYRVKLRARTLLYCGRWSNDQKVNSSEWELCLIKIQ